MRRIRKRWGILILSGLVLLFLLPWMGREEPAFARMGQQTLVIDPGHGGEDGGAVSVSGQAESDINLAIALQLDQLMGFYGVHTVLTRDSDVSIHDADANTIREKKVSDLHNRVDLINRMDQPTLISIHQNSYTGRQYRGTQVFYTDEVRSLPLANLVQDTVRRSLDPSNDRAPQKIPASVYLMNHISCRAILVECGFLSNPEEDRLLQQREYQLRLAMILAASYLESECTEEGGSLI